jgi:hypothetical protein
MPIVRFGVPVPLALPPPAEVPDTINRAELRGLVMSLPCDRRGVPTRTPFKTRKRAFKL